MRSRRVGTLFKSVMLTRPRSFEELWPKLRSTKSDNIPCDGWVARFETWSIDTPSPQKLNDISLCLDPAEVKAHIGESLKQRRIWEPKRPGGKVLNKTSLVWSLPFPTAIGADLDIVIVLRTAYITVKDPASQKSLPDTSRLKLCSIRLRGDGGNNNRFRMSTFSSQVPLERRGPFLSKPHRCRQCEWRSHMTIKSAEMDNMFCVRIPEPSYLEE